MDYSTSPFHRFTSWKILALLAVTLAYSLWFTTSGPYSALSDLAPGMPLEEQGFYTGNYAVETLEQLNSDGRRAKFISLIFDIPYMILWALVFEALIGFGVRRLAFIRPVWTLLFVLPIAFLLTDFAEDSFLALTLVTGSEIMGAFAGVMTFLKFLTFTAAGLIGFGLSVAGLVVWSLKDRSKA